MKNVSLRNIIREIVEQTIDSAEQKQIDEFIKTQALKTAKELGATIVDDSFIALYHGTNPGNAKKIHKNQRFNSGTFFSAYENDALKFGKQSMSKGEPTIFYVLIWAGSLLPASNFLTLREEVFNKDGRYVPKHML